MKPRLRFLLLDRREHHLLCHVLSRGLEDGRLGSPATKALLARIQGAKEVPDPRFDPVPVLDLTLANECSCPRCSNPAMSFDTRCALCISRGCPTP